MTPNSSMKPATADSLTMSLVATNASAEQLGDSDNQIRRHSQADDVAFGDEYDESSLNSSSVNYKHDRSPHSPSIPLLTATYDFTVTGTFGSPSSKFSNSSRKSFEKDQTRHPGFDERPVSVFRILIRRTLIGGLLGGLVALVCLLLAHHLFPSFLPSLSVSLCSSRIFPYAATSLQPHVHIRGQPPPTGIAAYFNLFTSRHSSSAMDHNSHASSTSSKNGSRRSRDLAESAIHDTQLVIAGKMTVDEQPCNIAQLNLRTNEWSMTERIQLSLYNSYSGGEVYSLLANHTSLVRPADDQQEDDTATTSASTASKRYVKYANQQWLRHRSLATLPKQSFFGGVVLIIE